MQWDWDQRASAGATLSSWGSWREMYSSTSWSTPVNVKMISVDCIHLNKQDRAY